MGPIGGPRCCDSKLRLPCRKCALLSCPQQQLPGAPALSPSCYSLGCIKPFLVNYKTPKPQQNYNQMDKQTFKQHEKKPFKGRSEAEPCPALRESLLAGPSILLHSQQWDAFCISRTDSHSAHCGSEASAEALVKYKDSSPVVFCVVLSIGKVLEDGEWGALCVPTCKGSCVPLGFP